MIGEQFKYIRYHGVWDLDQLYDTRADPRERKNLFNDPTQSERIETMNKELFPLLKNSTGENMPLLEDRGNKYFHRKSGGSKGAHFSKDFYRDAGTTGK